MRRGDSLDLSLNDVITSSSSIMIEHQRYHVTRIFKIIPTPKKIINTTVNERQTIIMAPTVNNLYKQETHSSSIGLGDSRIRLLRLIQQKASSTPTSVRILILGVLLLIVLHIVVFPNILSDLDQQRLYEKQLRTERVFYNDIHPNGRPQSLIVTFNEQKWEQRGEIIQQYQAIQEQKEIDKQSTHACPIKHIKDLTVEQKQPMANERHMVEPPKGGKLSLVCCETTKGSFTIVTHHKWAPIGAARFIDMVTSGYFNSGVPMMRCVKNFLCQFGL